MKNKFEVKVIASRDGMFRIALIVGDESIGIAGGLTEGEARVSASVAKNAIRATLKILTNTLEDAKP